MWTKPTGCKTSARAFNEKLKQPNEQKEKYAFVQIFIAKTHIFSSRNLKEKPRKQLLQSTHYIKLAVLISGLYS